MKFEIEILRMELQHNLPREAMFNIRPIPGGLHSPYTGEIDAAKMAAGELALVG